jgi:hypothetical protein
VLLLMGDPHKAKHFTLVPSNVIPLCGLKGKKN